MTPNRRYLIVGLVLTALLAFMIARKQYTVALGTPVQLELVRPVDPRSLFRGDYVRLDFAVGTLNSYFTVGDPDAFERNDTVWVVLRRAEPHWLPVSYHQEKPELGPDEVVMRGTVTGFPFRRRGTSGPGLRVKYGLENFFVPEGTGLKWEAQLAGEEVEVEVAVDGAGNAAVRAIIIKGKEVYREGLF